MPELEGKRSLRRHFFIFPCEPVSKEIWNKLSTKVTMTRNGGIYIIFSEVRIPNGFLISITLF